MRVWLFGIAVTVNTPDNSTNHQWLVLWHYYFHIKDAPLKQLTHYAGALKGHIQSSQNVILGVNKS